MSISETLHIIISLKKFAKVTPVEKSKPLQMKGFTHHTNYKFYHPS